MSDIHAYLNKIYSLSKHLLNKLGGKLPRWIRILFFSMLDQIISTWFKTNTAFTFLSSFAFISVQDALGIGHSEINGPVLFVLRVNAFFFWYFMVVLMKIIAHLRRYLDWIWIISLLDNAPSWVRYPKRYTYDIRKVKFWNKVLVINQEFIWKIWWPTQDF